MDWGYILNTFAGILFFGMFFAMGFCLCWIMRIIIYSLFSNEETYLNFPEELEEKKEEYFK